MTRWFNPFYGHLHNKGLTMGKYFFLLPLIAFAFPSLAQFRSHTFEIEIATLAKLDYQELSQEPGSHKELNDVGTFHYALSYEYNLSRYFSLGISYLDGESDEELSAYAILDAFTDSYIDYRATGLSARFQVPLSPSNSLYLDLERYRYHYEVFDDNEPFYSTSGYDNAFTLGWRIQFGSGASFKLGYQKFQLGDRISTRGIIVGGGFSF